MNIKICSIKYYDVNGFFYVSIEQTDLFPLWVNDLLRITFLSNDIEKIFIFCVQ